MLAVVYEAVANTGPGGKRRKVSSPHRVKMSVYPGVNLTFKNVYELFLFLFGVRPRTSLTRRQSHHVHANLKKTGSFADGPIVAIVLVGIGILVALLGN